MRLSRDSRTDPALSRKELPSGSMADVKSFFEEMRIWVELMCPLSSRYKPGQPTSSAVQLVMPDQVDSLKAQVLAKLSSGKVLNATPALALYLVTELTYVAEHVLRTMASIVERDAGRGEAGPAELFAAMQEDESLLDCFEGMVSRIS